MYKNLRIFGFVVIFMDCRLKFDYFMYLDFPVEICIQIANYTHSLILQRITREIIKHVLFLALCIYHLYKITLRRPDLKAMNTTPTNEGAVRKTSEEKVGLPAFLNCSWRAFFREPRNV